MAHPAGETNDGVLRLDFDRRLMLQFCGSVVTSDAGLLPYRELDDVLGLTVIAGNSLADARTGKNGRHALVGLLRQSVFSRLAGYEAVNDAGSLRHDPAMRWIVGGKAAQGSAASPSQMGRFEAQWRLTHLFSGGRGLRESGSLRCYEIAPRRAEQRVPSVGAVNIAGTKRTLFQVTELVEHEEGMIAGAFVMAVPDAHLVRRESG